MSGEPHYHHTKSPSNIPSHHEPAPNYHAPSPAPAAVYGDVDHEHDSVGYVPAHVHLEPTGEHKQHRSSSASGVPYSPSAASASGGPYSPSAGGVGVGVGVGVGAGHALTGITLPHGALGASIPGQILFSLDVHTEPDTGIVNAKQWLLVAGHHVIAGHTIFQPTSTLDASDVPMKRVSHGGGAPGSINPNPMYAQNSVHVLFDHISYVLYQTIRCKPSSLIHYAPDLQPNIVRWLIASTRAAATLVVRSTRVVARAVSIGARSLFSRLLFILCVIIAALLIAAIVIALTQTGAKGTVEGMQMACALVFASFGLLLIANFWHLQNFRAPSFIRADADGNAAGAGAGAGAGVGVGVGVGAGENGREIVNPVKSRCDGTILVLLLFSLMFCAAAAAAGIYFYHDANKSPSSADAGSGLGPSPGTDQTIIPEIQDWTKWEIFTCANYDYSCDECEVHPQDLTTTTITTTTNTTTNMDDRARNASLAEAAALSQAQLACLAKKEPRQEFCQLNDKQKNMCMLPERISAGALVVLTVLSLIFLLIALLLMCCCNNVSIPAVVEMVQLREKEQLYTQITLYGPPQHGFPIRVLLSAPDAVHFQHLYTVATTNTIAVPGMRVHTKATTQIDHQHAQVNTIPPANLAKSL